MADVFSKRKRSLIMSRIRSSGTKPEKVCRTVVRELSGRSVRYNVMSLPGTPDVVVHSMRLVIFMDGCFWHRCPQHGSKPKSNVDFWEAKLRRNVARDRKCRRELRSAGWTVWVLWEHDLRESALPRTRRLLRRRFRCMVSSSGGLESPTNSRRDIVSGGTTGPQGHFQKRHPMVAARTSKPAKKSTAKKPAGKSAVKTKSTAKPAARTAKKPAAKKPAAKKTTKKTAR